jgi:hypothetical protein
MPQEALGPMSCERPRLPANGDRDAPWLIDVHQRHVFDEQAQDFLTLGVARGVSPPQARQVLGQGQDLLALRLGELERGLPLDLSVVLLETELLSSLVYET